MLLLVGSLREFLEAWYRSAFLMGLHGILQAPIQTLNRAKP